MQVVRGVDTQVVREAPGEAITVLTPCGKRKERRVLRADGVSSGLNFGVHNNTLVNALRAVRERVFAVERSGSLAAPPRPRRGVIAERLAQFRAALVQQVGPCTPWTYVRFLASYTGSKLARYTRAVESLKVRELTKLDARLQSFVKAEAVNFTAKPDPAPRIIQPRNPRYNAFVGRFIRPLEHRVYKGIAELFGGPTVMKGYNAIGTAKCLRDMWDEFSQPVALSLDASRFDQHVSSDALRYEHSVYNRIYRSKQLASALRWQLRNHGFVRTSDGAYFQYVVEGCRMSGDMNTALGNCLLMCAMIWTYAAYVGVRVRLANNGDDCSVIMERRDLKRFQRELDSWFLEMGFTLTSDGVAEVFERLDFCQMRPVSTAAGWTMCRNPRTALCKDVLCKKPDMAAPLAGYARWAYQVGMAGSAIADGVPVFSAAYAAMIRTGTKSRKAQGFGDMDSGFEHLARGQVCRNTPITPEARASFWRAWGITPDCQECLEAQYAQLQRLDGIRLVMSVVDNPGIVFPPDSYDA
ncbi:putative RNA-dependent RNA polymerase [Freshwater macrophyte associated tombus-like virus 1]|nr:putative RNA-dependent RNA polymerase [Freshwater macrophyte associated tombus-like virus 1]